MNLRAFAGPILAASLLTSGCAGLPHRSDHNAPPLTVEQANARAPFLPALPPVVMSGELTDLGDPVKRKQMNFKPPKWPLRFEGAFAFNARCINTLECSIPFGGLEMGNKMPMHAKEAGYQRAYLDAFSGFYITPDFPGPVQITWRSLDGVAHKTQIDLKQIFGDRRVLHVVPREAVLDLPDGTYKLQPELLIEVNDRIIHAYMRALVPTRHLQIQGNAYSGNRDDLILARTFHY